MDPRCLAGGKVSGDSTHSSAASALLLSRCGPDAFLYLNRYFLQDIIICTTFQTLDTGFSLSNSRAHFTRGNLRCLWWVRTSQNLISAPKNDLSFWTSLSFYLLYGATLDSLLSMLVDQACPNYSTKCCVAAGFCSNQSKAHGLTNQLSEDWDQLIEWVRSGVLLHACSRYYSNGAIKKAKMTHRLK